MALKFLNKKGWHTGSLRNIENVWKAEQKHESEQKKLEELRKQIHEERDRNEFRLLQVKAGLVPAQERLDFLYDSGLSVGRSTDNEGFKALEAFPKSDATDAPPSSSASASKEQQGASVPGALFEDKPQSANDAWRKLHSDPLLMIRQREQEALAKIKNNPIKMAMIKKSVEETTHKEKDYSEKEKRKKHHSSKSKHKKQSDSEDDGTAERRKIKTDDKSRLKKQFDSEDEDNTAERRKRKSGDKSKHKKQSISEDHTAERRKRKTDDRDFDKKYHKAQSDSDYESSEREKIRSENHYEDKKYRERPPSHHKRHRNVKDYDEDADDRNYNKSKSERYASGCQSNIDSSKRDNESFTESGSIRERSPSRQQRHRNVRDYNEDAEDRDYNKSKSERYASGGRSNMDASKMGNGSIPASSSNRPSASSPEHGSHYKRLTVAPKLSEEERAAKLRQMQLAAELHEEQRWKRIKKAEETDAQEAIQNTSSGGRNFLDAAQKSVYGAAEGGSSSIAESVRRRTHYSQGRSAGEGNAFRR